MLEIRYDEHPFRSDRGRWAWRCRQGIEVGAMPYRSVRELPAPVRNSLPKHGQEIYKEAYNSAWKQYDKPGERRGDASREETAHRVAWAAVKKVYKKSGDRWVRKPK